MPMQLRSTTKLVPPPPSSDSVGSVEMDAPVGTSTDNGEELGESPSLLPALTPSVADNMGHSAKSHSGSQDAVEPGHRSGGSDHSRSKADVASSGSHSVTSQAGAVVTDVPAGSPLAASQGGSEEAAFHDASSEMPGFSFPKKSSRASSVRAGSPGLETAPRFFREWFESTDDDGLGTIPPAWMKQESVSIDLPWSSPVDSNGIDFSFDNLMREISENLTPAEKIKILQRNASMGNAKPAISISETTMGGSPATHVSIHPVNGNVNVPDSAYTSQPSRTANSTPRIPAAAKGKGRDFATAPSINYNDGYVSDSEAADDEDRLYQLQADALLAMKLQHELNTQGRAHTADVPVAGPSGVEHNADNNSAVMEQTSKDHEFAASMQLMLDAQYKRMQELKGQEPAHHHDGSEDPDLWRRRGDAGKRNKAPNVRPSPMDQVPKSSILFREMNAGEKPSEQAARKSKSLPPLSDDSSSSSSESDGSRPSFLKKSGKSSKKSKKSRSKKYKKAKNNCRPDEALQESNAKPAPPFVYNGEPVFNTIERWTYEARDWTSESYIRPKMRVSRVSKYLGGNALTWYMRVVAKDAKKWTLKKFFEALFNHCFPVDFRSLQRKKFQNFAQRGHPIKQYKTELEVLADSIGDITTRGLIVQFWDGADYEMRVRGAGDGYDPETSKLKELEAAAINYEHAIKVARTQKPDHDGKKSDHPGKKNDRNSKGGTSRQEGGNNRNAGPHKDSSTRFDRKDSRNQASGSGKRQGDPKPKDGGNRSHKLSKEQMNEYRAQGKCFTCGETGHLSKDCATSNQLKPKHCVTAAAVSFEEVERRRSLSDAQRLGVFAVSIEHAEITPEHEQAIDEVLVAKMHSDLRREVPFVFDYFGDPEDDPLAEDRLTIVPLQLGWLVCDGHTNDHHEILRTQLLDPEFDFIMHLYNEKWAMEDQLYTEHHPVRVKKRQRAEDETFVNLPPMVPLSRCESPEAETANARRQDLPQAFRRFLRRLECDPDAPGAAEEVIESLVTDFMNCVPYSFDEMYHGDSIFDPARFEVDYLEREFFVVTDNFHERGYLLDYPELLAQGWDPREFMERVYADLDVAHEELGADVGWIEEEFETEPETESSWSGCSFDLPSGNGTPPPPPPPPPPPAAGIAANDNVNDSDSELGEPPELEEQSDSDSESDLNSPDLRDFEYSSDEDADDEGSSENSDDEPDDRTHAVLAAATTPSKSRKPAEQSITYQRNASTVRDFARLVPRPMVIVVYVNDKPATALLDSGSLADFISTKVVDQLHLKTDILTKPLNVSMAVTGSRTMVNHSCNLHLRYQGIDEERRFDVMNIANYDLILGTPFLFQHQIVFGLDPPQIRIGSTRARPIRGEQVTTLSSLAMDLYEDSLEVFRKELREYAADICVDALKTPLPPL
ncbi:hypothetical protein B0H16DRAFT_1883392 [Mycena metata]|uniref:CCHC-type domain-containing protein n=1 Tax=Mycena metata TaxID=1033252 RepID=A0AAD7JHB1_9AGAR|nr:hypothetical protein B0H16DRAFT_1883392 [Mycena metata]